MAASTVGNPRKNIQPRGRPPKLDFKYAFHPVVELAPGEICGWPKHFENVFADVIWFLDGQARRNPALGFTWVFVETILDGINKNRIKLGKKPYKKRAVEYALHLLEDLGIIVRVPGRRWKGQKRMGYFVARHDEACMPSGNACRFMSGDDAGLLLITKPIGGD
jgi:hypothetical protein